MIVLTLSLTTRRYVCFEVGAVFIEKHLHPSSTVCDISFGLNDKVELTIPPLSHIESFLYSKTFTWARNISSSTDFLDRKRALNRVYGILTTIILSVALTFSFCKKNWSKTPTMFPSLGSVPQSCGSFF